MKNRYLTMVACLFAGVASAAPFEKDLSLQGITFHVKSKNEGSTNPVEIKVKGLKGGDITLNSEADGSVTGAEVADLNSDNFPEIYIFTQSAGSGSYGNIIGWSSNRNLSATEIYVWEMSRKDSKGYMGHDEFAIVEQYLVRRFPIYKSGDTNSKPTGGSRQVQYLLKAGEAGWILRPVKTITFKEN